MSDGFFSLFLLSNSSVHLFTRNTLTSVSQPLHKSRSHNSLNPKNKTRDSFSPELEDKLKLLL